MPTRGDGGPADAADDAKNTARSAALNNLRAHNPITITWQRVRRSGLYAARVVFADGSTEESTAQADDATALATLATMKTARGR